MKSVFLIGGLLGFCLVLVAGLTAGRAPLFVLRDAAFGCLAGGLLFRWFWRVLLRALDETARRRRDEAARASAETEEPVPAARPAHSR